MKSTFYYMRDEENRPIVTICLVKEGDKVARGMSICSALDLPRKADGRNRAMGRAMEAIKYKGCSKDVRRPEVKTLLARLSGTKLLDSQHLPTSKFKSGLLAVNELTEFERKILSI